MAPQLPASSLELLPSLCMEGGSSRGSSTLLTGPCTDPQLPASCRLWLPSLCMGAESSRGSSTAVAGPPGITPLGTGTLDCLDGGCRRGSNEEPEVASWTVAMSWGKMSWMVGRGLGRGGGGVGGSGAKGRLLARTGNVTERFMMRWAGSPQLPSGKAWRPCLLDLAWTRPACLQCTAVSRMPILRSLCFQQALQSWMDTYAGFEGRLTAGSTLVPWQGSTLTAWLHPWTRLTR